MKSLEIILQALVLALLAWEAWRDWRDRPKYG